MNHAAASFEDVADLLEAVVAEVKADSVLRAAVERLPPGPELDRKVVAVVMEVVK